MNEIIKISCRDFVRLYSSFSLNKCHYYCIHFITLSNAHTIFLTKIITITTTIERKNDGKNDRRNEKSTLSAEVGNQKLVLDQNLKKNKEQKERKKASKQANQRKIFVRK